MELLPEISEMVQQRLGHNALATQAAEGRGAWIATAKEGGIASYVRLTDLPNVFKGGSQKDFEQLLTQVTDFDPLKQVVVVFPVKPDVQIIATVDIE